MKVKYRVHSAKPETVAVKAMLGGREVDATVPGLTVEMTRARFSHTFRFVPDSADELAAAVELFKPGAKVDASFTPHIEG